MLRLRATAIIRMSAFPQGWVCVWFTEIPYTFSTVSETQEKPDNNSFLGTILFIYCTHREREGEREGSINAWDKHRLVTSHICPNQELAQNPGVRPDREPNHRPFTLQDKAQPAEPCQSGHNVLIIEVGVMPHLCNLQCLTSYLDHRR